MSRPPTSFVPRPRSGARPRLLFPTLQAADRAVAVAAAARAAAPAGAKPAPAAPVVPPAAPVERTPPAPRPPDLTLTTTLLPAPRIRATPSDLAVAAAAATVAPITLDELNALAELQTRVDRKYFVHGDAFRRLIGQLAGGLRVLEIDGRRTFGYESIYFDTPQLLTYRAHLQRRRQRFKARTRTYTDSGLCMFEVKLTGARGETVKERIKHPIDERNVLTPGALDHLGTALRRTYGQALPRGMRAMLDTTYRRTTFVSRTGEVRLTCDVGLVCNSGTGKVTDKGTHVLVESKSAGGDGGPDRILRDLGVRPVSVSKYCVGIAALHPDLPSNPWHDTLRRYFGPRTAA